jgi:hypothetical protein
MVAAAVIGAAVVGAAGSAYAGSEASSATNKASNAAISEQQQALSQQATLSQPYRDLGTANLPTYQALLSGDTAQKTLEQTPGYKTTLATGIEAAKRSSAASGLNLSGNQVAGVETYGAQLADQTYQQQLNNLLQPIQLGQAAAAGQAANVGTSASNIGNIGINQGNTTANIDANTIAGITRAGTNATNQLVTYNTLNNLNQNPSTPASVPTYGGTPNFDGSANYGSTPTYDTPPPGYG